MGLGNMNVQSGQTGGKMGPPQSAASRAPTSMPINVMDEAAGAASGQANAQDQLAKMVAGGNAYQSQQAARSGQPRFGAPNPYASSIGMQRPWDNASLMPRTMGKGVGKGGAPASPFAGVQQSMQAAQNASKPKQTTPASTATNNPKLQEQPVLMDATERGW